MNKLIGLLNTPYPPLCNRWKRVLIPSVIVFLILLLLQPFGVSELRSNYKVLFLLGHGVVSALMLSIPTYLLPALFPSYYKEQAWTLGRELLGSLLTYLLIAIGIWLYTAWMFNLKVDIHLFLICVGWVLLLAPFPTILFIMWNRNLLLKRNLREAMEINLALSQKGLAAPTAGKSSMDTEENELLLTFRGGTKEVLEINASDFLYAEAEGNYIRVNYCASSGSVERKTMRATMKQAEEAIADAPSIVRCHRAFLVNIGRITKVDGNSQGYRLQLKGCNDEVPVSRAYAKSVKEQLESIG